MVPLLTEKSILVPVPSATNAILATGEEPVCFSADIFPYATSVANDWWLLNTRDLPAIFAEVEMTIPLDPPVLTASPTIKFPALREKSGANLIWDPVTS